MAVGGNLVLPFVQVLGFTDSEMPVSKDTNGLIVSGSRHMGVSIHILNHLDMLFW